MTKAEQKYYPNKKVDKFFNDRREMQKRYEKMESALKVIHTWASYYRERFMDMRLKHHEENLEDISNKCLEALGKKKK